MQAIELEATIDSQQELRLKLPKQAKAGLARVIVLYEEAEPAQASGNLDGFLAKLPFNAVGRSHSDIVRQIEEERVGWQDEP